MNNKKLVYKIPGNLYVDRYDDKKNDYNYYIVFESIQFINRERRDNNYGISGSICIGTPILFFRSSRIEDTIEIIKKDSVKFKKNSYSESEEEFYIDRIYDLSINNLTIFRPEKYKFPKKENREYKLGEILKTDIN